MKAFLLSCVAIVVVAVGAYYGLNAVGFSTADATTGASVRLD
ncbi:hypothetical protein [Thiosulfatihalobacter marinus]|jgi:hypothetical protein|nr:hypothetical protein [Thiosulfatihalobacter marinus]